MPLEYRLARPEVGRAPAPDLDQSQRAVVEHRGSPLLVLAGPGTGKTTTVVEAVVDRVESGELTPEQILVLTFSRKAAEELRTRIAARLPETSAIVPAMTFHSFCYRLVLSAADEATHLDPPALLNAAELDARISELLAGRGTDSWPESLRQALGIGAFSSELQSFISTAMALGLDGAGVADLARELDRPDWLRVAEFWSELDEVNALANVTDYAGVIAEATGVAAAGGVRFSLVVVDEYQDTDPMQVRLLKSLVRPGTDLIAVGDPDQSIYGFRGADVRGIGRFIDDFGGRTLALQRTRRFGQAIVDVSRRIIEPVGAVGPITAEMLGSLRAITSDRTDPGRVDVVTFATEAAEIDGVAEHLRRAHLGPREGGTLDWSQMAVLVRTAHDLGRFRRGLAAAGVPVEVTGDEVPLAAEPAVRQLILALEVAEQIGAGRAPEPDLARAVLTGPLGGLDEPDLRRLGRHLRRTDDDPLGPRPSPLLLAHLLLDPGPVPDRLDAPTLWAARRAHALATLLRRAAEQIAARESSEQVLWTLWDGTDWPRQLREDWEAGAQRRRQADRDLDAVCALFAAAARAEERQGRRSVSALVDDLRAQQIPADRLADSTARASGVRLMTAHRSKGLQWPLVVVPGVQDGVWPNLRSRSSLLQRERLATAGAAASTTAEQARDERRLFYVASTRAESELLITAVQSATEGGAQPSRFVLELLPGGGIASPAPRRRPERPLSLPGVVAELRDIAENGLDEAARAEAVRLLATIAAADTPGGRAARPDRWWGVRERTVNDVPVRDPHGPVGLSGSQLSTLGTCPLRWFLGHEVKGERATSSAQGFGSIVHAIVADVVNRQIAVPDPAELESVLDQVWHRLEYDAPWIAGRDREQAAQALARFARWHVANPRTPVAVEHEFTAEFEVDGRPVAIRGSMDRVEVDSEGFVHVVDFKTSKRSPNPAEVAADPQLATYQLAVLAGATEDVVPGGRPGGAELVQLRDDAKGEVKVQPQDRPAPDEPFFGLDLVRRAVRTIDAEDFVAMPGKHCDHCDFHQVCPTTSGTIGGTGGRLAP